MTHQQWEVIERSLAGLSVDEKREVAGRILQSIRGESPAADRVRQQREALNRLCQKVDALPTAQHSDGLTNRDHDRLIYTR
jgi:hypothetical protein